MVRLKIAPDIEFKLELELKGITMNSRDHDVQQHKKEVYDAFVARLRKAFAEDEMRIDTFEFALDTAEVLETVG